MLIDKVEKKIEMRFQNGCLKTDEVFALSVTFSQVRLTSPSKLKRVCMNQDMFERFFKIQCDA